MAQYNEYKESGQQWLGKVPSHWGLLPGKALFLENKRKNVDNSIREVLSLSYGKIIRKKNIDEGLVPENYCGYQIVEPNDIIIRCTDLQNDKVSLRTGFVENFGIISGAYLGLKCISPNLPKYLHYYLHTWDITKELYRYGAGLRQSLSWNDVKYLSILIPPADEQAGIVAYLDKVTADIDKAIVAKERIISALEERRKIIITEAVTRGINPDAPLRDSGIDWLGQIPAHWEIVPLKTICRFGQSLNITKADLVEEGFPVINYGQVHSKFNSKTALSDELIRYVPKFHADNSPNCLCGKNDFIVADTSEDIDGCGNMVFIDQDIDVLAGYHTYSLKEVKLSNPKFLAYQMASNTWRFQIRKNVNAVKVYTISKSILKQSLIWIPSDIEQGLIVEKLDKETSQIDCILVKLKESIDLLRERKAIIINEVVTGKVKVV